MSVTVQSLMEEYAAFAGKLNEARTLTCPGCGEEFGKDTESPRRFKCSNCGTAISNPRGYTDDD